MKAKELRELTVEELRKRGKELRHELLNMRMQQVTGQLENTARIRLVRNDIARVETILTERRHKAALTPAS
jgi:large subunit ribosomal protein L29